MLYFEFPDDMLKISKMGGSGNHQCYNTSKQDFELE